MFPDDFEVLPSRVENLDDSGISHEGKEGGEIEPFGKRVDRHSLIIGCELDHTDFRPERRLAQKLRIDGNEWMLGEAGATGGEVGGRGDKAHIPPITCSLAACEASAPKKLRRAQMPPPPSCASSSKVLSGSPRARMT